MTALVPFLIFGTVVGLHPAVAEVGRSHQRGCLTQYTRDGTTACFDPDKLTIVISHGFNPLPCLLRLTTPEAYARAILCRYGDQVNVFGWDWNAETFRGVCPRRNTLSAIRQGHLLACELKRLGVRSDRTWLIGHSLGALLMSKTAQEMASCGPPIARLTLLDALQSQHRMIFGWFHACGCARRIENYWAGGLSGVGTPSGLHRVHNYFVPGGAPFAFFLGPRSNHVRIIEWYYETICNPCFAQGFNRPCCFTRL